MDEVMKFRLCLYAVLMIGFVAGFFVGKGL